MSYPDLGCFAECLECEICGDTWMPPSPDGEAAPDLDLGDFDLPDGYFDPDWAPDPLDDFYDPPDPYEAPGPFDDFEVPGVDLPGGGRLTPDWNDGPGFEAEWPW